MKRLASFAAYEATMASVASVAWTRPTDACLDEMLADARARASIPAQAFVTCYRGRCAMWRGAVAQAEIDARTTLELLTSHDIRLGARIARDGPRPGSHKEKQQ